MKLADDDVDLLHRIAAGDRTAVRTLFARHHLRIYRFVTRLTGNEATAEDITNDVFLEVWRNAATFEGRASVSTWMLSIARNKSISAMRRRTESAIDETMADGIADEADTPEVVAAKHSKGEQLRRCIEKLSDDHREIVELVYYQEKSIQEVAEIAGIPEGTVKTRMFHARKRLGEILRQAGIDRGWP